MFEQKWFKLILLFVFFSLLLYVMCRPSFEINKNDLVELNATVDKGWEAGGNKNPVKLYFTIKEYSNQFEIYVGGTFGRWTEVIESLEPNSKIIVKIHKSNIQKLNIKKKVIPIYYLKNDKSQIIFTENQFNEGEKSSDNRVMWFFIILFVFCLWKVLTE